MNPLRSSFRLSQPFTVICLIISAALNVALATQLRNVRPTRSGAPQGLPIGMAVPPIDATTLDGKPTTVTYAPGNLPSVLYVFTPPCGWCARNTDNINALATQLTGKYRVVGISLDKEDLSEYVKKARLPFPVLYDVPKETRRTYLFGTTPQTLVVSPDGQVLKAWYGAYQFTLKADIEQYFGVTLPGLSAAPARAATKTASPGP